MSSSQAFRTLSDQATSLKPGRYRHFKGGEYRFVGIGKNTETLEEYVVYQKLDVTDDMLCVRPVAMFLESVDRDDYNGPRFVYLRE